MAGSPSTKTTPKKETEKWLSNQNPTSKTTDVPEDQLPSSSASSSSEISSTNAVVGANDNENLALFSRHPQGQATAPVASTSSGVASSHPLRAYHLLGRSPVRRYSPNQDEVIDTYCRKENTIRIERELAEDFAALGGKEEDLEGFWEGEDKDLDEVWEAHGKDAEAGGIALSTPAANNEASTEAQDTIATTTTAAVPQEQVPEPSSSAHAPLARRQMTPLELTYKVHNLLMAFRKTTDARTACYVLNISAAIDVIGVDEFIHQPGATRDVLLPGSFFHKNALKVNLPAGIHRWIKGEDASETLKYPIATVDAALKPIETALKKVMEKGMS